MKDRCDRKKKDRWEKEEKDEEERQIKRETYNNHFGEEKERSVARGGYIER